MADHQSKVDRLVSIDVSEKFEALQDEVDLIKTEIKQTLVDLREFMMKERTIFPQVPMRTPPVDARSTPSTGLTQEKQLQGGSSSSPSPSIATSYPETPPQHLSSRSHGGEVLNPAMLGNIIQWLGTIKGRGLSLQQITPYLEAYETSGYLAPIMVKVLLRSVADLDQLAEIPTDQEFSPQDYSECIRKLHDIICAPDYGAESLGALHKVHGEEPYMHNMDMGDGQGSAGPEATRLLEIEGSEAEGQDSPSQDQAES